MIKDQERIFHPVNQPEPAMESDFTSTLKPATRHLFGLGMLAGIGIAGLLSFGFSYLGITQIAPGTSAGYTPMTIESAIQVFDQIEVIAKERDAFFHQENKIYNFTGEVSFHKLDNLFHILDNMYLAATGVDAKYKVAEKLDMVITKQNDLFEATRDINTDRANALKVLGDTFHSLQQQISQ